jgi:hypothetical protein
MVMGLGRLAFKIAGFTCEFRERAEKGADKERMWYTRGKKSLATRGRSQLVICE